MTARLALNPKACEQEAIRVPGSIQPHGVLLSLDAESLVVLQASENACAAFELPNTDIVGASVFDLLTGKDGAELKAGLSGVPADGDLKYLGMWTRAKYYQMVAHRQHSRLILELSETDEYLPAAVSFENLFSIFMQLTNRLQQESTVEGLLDLAARLAQELTGFDRALVYQFAPDWHGHVVAESRKEFMPSYMDLWFPASDIPAQARELYKSSRVRIISDVGGVPVPLWPQCDPSGTALDLTHATLRSVSPVHLEYLHNMGVSASMSISIRREGELWGLIVLHNKTPRRVRFEMRVATDLLGQLLSLKLAQIESQVEFQNRLRLKSIATKLLALMTTEPNFIAGLTKYPDELMSLGCAEGCALMFEGRCTLWGRTPRLEVVGQLAQHLGKLSHEEVFETDCSGSVFSGLDGLQERASGIMAISISELHNSHIVWFRPELIQAVKWGGDPSRHVEQDAINPERLHPRKSFEIWKETVRGRSLPWRTSEMETAAEFRGSVVGIVFRKAEELAALSAELQRSNKELEAFSYSISHDLRAPFRHIVGYADLLRGHLGDALDKTGDRYISTIMTAAESAGGLVDDLLNYSRVGRSALHAVPMEMERLVAEVRNELSAEQQGRTVLWEMEKLPAIEGDPVLLRHVWVNLISNALKFTRHRDEARITIGSERAGSEVVFFVRDNGVGFNQHYVDKLFGVFQRLHSMSGYEGNGIGLANVRRAVAMHGGRTWAEGEQDKGATFYFSLPLSAQESKGAYA